jgi:membrane fusion protein (multidrug efflux system)
MNAYMNKFASKRDKMSLKRLLVVVLLLSGLFVYGCSKESAAGGGGFSMPPMPVEAAETKAQKVADKFEAVGNVEAIEAITVVSEIDAMVLSLPFEEGTFLKKGSLIAQLDDSQLSAEVARAEALFDQSKASYDRVKKIVDQKAASLQDLDDAAAAMKVAKANYDLAKARLSKTRIVAPFDGVIGSRRVSVGSFLRPGDPITELANINEIRVTFSAPERYLSDLRRGADVEASSTAYPDYKVNGKIIVVESVLDPATRNVRVVARVPNKGGKFLPGMSANIAAVLSERPNALTIPTQAVFAAGNQNFVFVINPDSTVVTTPVTLGLQMADVVEVTHGLEAGKKVVQAGHQKLFDGAKVMPMPSANMDMSEAVQQQ